MIYKLFETIKIVLGFHINALILKLEWCLKLFHLHPSFKKIKIIQSDHNIFNALGKAFYIKVYKLNWTGNNTEKIQLVIKPKLKLD